MANYKMLFYRIIMEEEIILSVATSNFIYCNLSVT